VSLFFSFDIPPVLLFSIDGFKAEYLYRDLTPNIHKLGILCLCVPVCVCVCVTECVGEGVGRSVGVVGWVCGGYARTETHPHSNGVNFRNFGLSF